MSNDGNKVTLAKNLRYYVRKFGKTQKEMSKIVGVAPATFNDWMKAKAYPRIDKIELMANYFKIQKSDLIEDKIDMLRATQTSNTISTATKLGAGKYVFGVNIPEGTYDLKAIFGSGVLTIASENEVKLNFGDELNCAKTYHGLSLSKNQYFEVTGNVVFEITKTTMIEIK